MLRSMIRLASLTIAFLGFAANASAAPVIYVDAAPNGYGSPNYAGWWTAAQSSAANGSFVNMAHSYNPANAGTTSFEINDAVVYSFGDLGSRLSFVYWLPGETIASLTEADFQIAVVYEYAGVEYNAYEQVGWGYWVTPTSWIETSSGVVGAAGNSLWAAYGVNTPEALAADMAEFDRYLTSMSLLIRMTNDDGGEEIYSLTAHHTTVPEPATLALLGLGLLGMGIMRRRAA